MKKLFAVMLAASLAMAATGCAGEKAAETTAAETTAAATTAAETEAAETEAAETEAAEAEAETAEIPAVMTYDEYMAAELDSAVTIEAYVQATQSWWEDQVTIYAQDENGAYFLYNVACSEEDYEKLVPGTKIRATGYKAEWSGEIEIMDGTFEFVEGDPYIAEPVDVTELLGTDELISHQNQLVSFKGMTVEAAGQDESGNDIAYLYNWDGSGSEGDDLYFTVSKDGEKYSFLVESYLCDSSSEVYQAVKNLSIGDTIDMEGFLYWYEGVNPHITSVTAAE